MGNAVCARRFRLLALIRRNAALGMLAPSFEEYMKRENIKSKSTAGADFQRLVDMGHVRRLPRRARAIEPVTPAKVQHFIVERVDGEARLAPLLSTVAAVHAVQEGGE